MVVPRVMPSVMQGEDPWGIPSIYPAAILSIGCLIVGSLLTPPPSKERLEKLFPEAKPEAEAKA
jgi:hypothetical protein